MPGRADEGRICSRCRERLPASEFARYGEGLQAYCRRCQKEYDAAWYAANKAKRKSKVKADRKTYGEWLDSLKEGRPCADCGGIFPPYALEWHHRPGVEKRLTLADTRRAAFGKKRILAEIAKCELICANCHRERTFGKPRGSAA